MDYATLSLAEVKAGLEGIARDTEATFGRMSRPQLNWKPDATKWSVAQCFAHLAMANQLLCDAADVALKGTTARTVWQRLPIWPGLVGRMLVRSQAPSTTRRFTAPEQARPTASNIDPVVIQRFIDQTRDAAKRVDALDENNAARTVMTSPFIGVITYSVLDGWRLVLAHDRRHFEQARRVTLSPGFPEQTLVIEA